MTAIPGDWVRFERQGRLVVGVVSYVRTNVNGGGTVYVYTDQGAVPQSQILESRTAGAALIGERAK